MVDLFWLESPQNGRPSAVLVPKCIPKYQNFNHLLTTLLRIGPLGRNGRTVRPLVAKVFDIESECVKVITPSPTVLEKGLNQFTVTKVGCSIQQK